MPYAPGIRAVLDPATQSGIGPLSARVFGVGAAVLATIPVPEAASGSAIYYLSASATAAALVAANLPAGAYELALYSSAGAHVADASLGWTGSVEYDPSAGTAVEVLTGTPVEVVAGPSPLTEQQVQDAAAAAIGALSGTGALPVTVTVTDAVTQRPVQQANVRATINDSSYTATTNTSGGAAFALDGGAYTISVTAGGYAGTSTTANVSSLQQVVSVSLTANTVPVPSTPGTVAGTLAVATPGTMVSFQQRTTPSGLPCSPASTTATADGNGLVTVTLVAGVRYAYWVGTGVKELFVSPPAGSFDVAVAAAAYPALGT